MDDDKLLTTFFAENKQEIADNGFSRRVMHRLPDRSKRLSRIWTAFCSVLALVLFISLDGFHLLLNALRETFDTALQNAAATELDPQALVIAAVVLIYFACRKVVSLA